MKLKNIEDTKIVVMIIAKYYKYLELVRKEIPEALFGVDVELLPELSTMMSNDIKEIIDEENYNGEKEELEEFKKIKGFDNQIYFAKNTKYMGSTDWIDDLLFDFAHEALSFNEIWEKYENHLKRQIN